MTMMSLTFLKQISQIADPRSLIQLYAFLFVLVAAIVAFTPPAFSARLGRCRWLLPSATCWSIVVFAVVALHYLSVPTFYDHVEPAVVDIARLHGHGMPIYHDIDFPSRYSLLYGPNTFIVHYIAMLVCGESMTTFKLPGIILAIASLALTVAAVRTAVGHTIGFHLAVIDFCGMTLLFREKFYWARSEPQILFWSALGVFGATRRSPVFSAVVVGAALGGCFNVKIHAFLLFSPLLALIASRLTLRYGLIVLATATAMIALPFLVFPTISLSNYLFWLKAATRHGFSAEILRDVLIYAGVMGMPLAMQMLSALGKLSASCRVALLRRRMVPLLFGGVGVVALVILASKRRAGEWHLMPMLPVVALIFASVHAYAWHETQGDSDPLIRTCLGSVVCLSIVSTLAAVIPVIQSICVATIKKDAGYNRVTGAIADIRAFAIAHSNESMAMGYGDDSGYSLTSLRPLLPVPNRFLCDAAALMDMDFAKIPVPKATIKKLDSGVVKLWLIPRGQEPFALRNLYDLTPVFSDEFRGSFRRNYERSGSTKYFDIWSYHSKTEH